MSIQTATGRMYRLRLARHEIIGICAELDRAGVVYGKCDREEFTLLFDFPKAYWAARKAAARRGAK